MTHIRPSWWFQVLWSLSLRQRYILKRGWSTRWDIEAMIVCPGDNVPQYVRNMCLIPDCPPAATLQLHTQTVLVCKSINNRRQLNIPLVWCMLCLWKKWHSFFHRNILHTNSHLHLFSFLVIVTSQIHYPWPAPLSICVHECKHDMFVAMLLTKNYRSINEKRALFGVYITCTGLLRNILRH